MTALVLYLLLQVGIVGDTNVYTQEAKTPSVLQINCPESVGGTWDDEG